MSFRKQLFLLLAAWLLAVPAFAATGGGQSGSQSLRLLRGARAAGLGGAYVAVASGVDSMQWNPAGLNQLRALQAGAGHLSWLDGVSDDYLQIGMPIYGLGAWGFAMDYLYAQDTAYDNWGNAGETFNVFDFSAQLAMSVELPWDMHVGAVYKTLRQGYGSQFAMGSALDLGWQWRDLFKRLDLGVTMQNIGTPMALGSNFAVLPITYKAGAALHLTPQWLVAVDFDHQPIDFFNKWHAGTEYATKVGDWTVAGRGGYTLGPEQDQGSLAGLAMGFGFGTGKWMMDYAFTPQGDLGQAHRVSLTWSSWLN
jgi:hypothetical protein